jgi:glycogen operon protein
LYEHNGRKPYASINFVTSHDGFSLNDLVSHNEKHNSLNGPENNGDDHNLSWNCGAEGATDDATILKLRRRQMRNFMATLLFSQGVPMLRGGDEICHSQQGNNNTYCQDNELSWMNWNIGEKEKEFFDFVAKLIRLRHRQPVLRRRRFFQGRKIRGSSIVDIVWFSAIGSEMSDSDWNAPENAIFGVEFCGKMHGELDDRGKTIQGRSILIFFNPSNETMDITLPELRPREYWKLSIDSSVPSLRSKKLRGGESYRLTDHSIIGLERTGILHEVMNRLYRPK